MRLREARKHLPRRFAQPEDEAVRKALCARRQTLKAAHHVRPNPYTIEAVARRAGVAQRTLRNWESGANRPICLAQWRDWALALGADLDVLVKEPER